MHFNFPHNIFILRGIYFGNSKRFIKIMINFLLPISPLLSLQSRPISVQCWMRIASIGGKVKSGITETDWIDCSSHLTPVNKRGGKEPGKWKWPKEWMERETWSHDRCWQTLKESTPFWSCFFFNFSVCQCTRLHFLAYKLFVRKLCKRNLHHPNRIISKNTESESYRR